ncbi:response regulator [Caldimonas tepidiphila]|uniref:response regulator n=1 Tax=Caldimonas tepidiphila TaxID=2315841 RepID=UPI0013005704|nr:response regulator [Caldimonas tepidiphila]
MSTPTSCARQSFELHPQRGRLRAAEPADSRRRAGGMRILVVEDAPEAARLLATLLGMAGHEARFALDAEEALEALERFQPEGVILDLGLPGMGGIELARRLRSEPGSPRSLLMIALTAEQGSDIQAQVMQAGCDHFMAKPLHFERLCELLAQWQDEAGNAAPRRPLRSVP